MLNDSNLINNTIKEIRTNITKEILTKAINETNYELYLNNLPDSYHILLNNNYTLKSKLKSIKNHLYKFYLLNSNNEIAQVYLFENKNEYIKTLKDMINKTKDTKFKIIEN